MIIVEVAVPSLGRSYNIRVNEDIPAGIMRDEVLSLVAGKLGETEENTEAYQLFSMGQGCCLRDDLPVCAQEIRDGSRLVLI